MSYRGFNKPISTNWTTRDWLNWAMDERLLLDVRTDIPEGVCAGCYGGTDTGYQTSVPMPDEFGFPTYQTVVGRWPRCYPCNNLDGLDGILPISYSLHDRLESAIWRATAWPAPTASPFPRAPVWIPSPSPAGSVATGPTRK